MPLGNSFAVIKGRIKISYFNFNIIISSSVNGFVLTDDLISLGWDQKTPVNGTVTINTGVTIGSFIDKSGPSFNSINMPKNSIISIINNGDIIGRGGSLDKPSSSFIGEYGLGGSAMAVSGATHFLLNNGIIAGGGGRGGFQIGHPGGGAGVPPGRGRAAINPPAEDWTGLGKVVINRTASQAGTRTTGGSGGTVNCPTKPGVGAPGYHNGAGGAGGALGTAGSQSGNWYGYTANGSSGGISIEGRSTWVKLDPASTGTIIGRST